MSQPEIGAGDVKIELVGHGEVTLRPTLNACRQLSGSQGGIAKMVERCSNFEFNAIHEVIVAGLNGKGSKELQDLIYQTGLLELAPACINFLHIVINGGRPLVETRQEENEDPLEKSSL